MEAASECLARFGYDKTTMDDIAGRIGLNKTSLYYYPNKESIFIAVIVQEAKVFLAALQAKAIEANGCRDPILTYLTERFRSYQKVVNLHNLSTETLRRMQPAFKAVYQDVLDREIAFIGQLLQSGTTRVGWEGSGFALTSETLALFFDITRPGDRNQYFLRLSVGKHGLASLINRKIVHLLWMTLLALVLLRLLGDLFARRLSQPIEVLSRSAEEVARGDLSARLPRACPLDTVRCRYSRAGRPGRSGTGPACPAIRCGLFG